MKRLPMISAITALLVALSGCSLTGARSDVGVQLFMFNWTSVAKECEESLGPAGVSWVLVSPPQEHISKGQWWVHYQPVSYKIESRLGTRQQFRDMVSRCKNAGVDVIADAVINHMAGSSFGEGWAGSDYEKYNYPGIYSAENFHDCGLTENNQIVNFSDREQVQTCELLGLSDLDTGSEYVQQQIVNYLKDLLSLGVAGFRIDAAKHISAQELEQIFGKLPPDTVVMHEVIRGGGEEVQPEDYLSTGKLWEFSFSRAMTSFIVETVPNIQESLETGYFLESQNAISFVSNHDTERNGSAVAPQSSPAEFELATIFMLASDYGTPMLYSGYSYLEYDQAPPLGPSGLVLDANCDDRTVWLCIHRNDEVRQMISWRDKTRSLELSNFTHKESYSAWSKGDRGFFAVNAANVPLKVSLGTSLPTGLYCNILKLGLDEKSCTGNEIEVTPSGKINLVIEPLSAVALLRD